jgi:hypothetical protein
MYSLGEKTRMLTGLSLPMLCSLLAIREEGAEIPSIAAFIPNAVIGNLPNLIPVVVLSRPRRAGGFPRFAFGPLRPGLQHPARGRISRINRICHALPDPENTANGLRAS